MIGLHRPSAHRGDRIAAGYRTLDDCRRGNGDTLGFNAERPPD